MAPELIIALDAAPGNTRRDTQLAQMGEATSNFIALVCMLLVWPASGLTATPTHDRQGTGQLLKYDRVMAIGSGDAEDQRDALAVCDDVAFATEFAPVRRAEVGVLTPRLATPPTQWSLAAGDFLQLLMRLLRLAKRMSASNSYLHAPAQVAQAKGFAQACVVRSHIVTAGV